MKITDRLLADHKSFRKMLEDLDAVTRQPLAARDNDKLRRVVHLLRRTILLHAWVEDNVCFPAAAKAPLGLPESFLAHLTQEHKTIDGYLTRLAAQVDARPPAAAWPQTFALVLAGLRGHFKREEEDLFPAAERVMGASVLDALSDEADRRKSEAPPPAL